MNTTIVTCDMVEGCKEPIAYIDIKGYVYCRAHGIDRKDTCRCRRLTPKELRQILSGEPLARY
jgi:hypothetical protein